MGRLTRLADRVAARDVAARDLVRTALERIETLDPALNAVVGLRADEALDEARALDERLSRGERAGPLAGLPVLVKDVTDVIGMRTTFGSLLFADAPLASEDGLVPRRLRAAGAIIIGKTNTPEFATQGYTANRLFGATRNPWNRDASPGGSSGGSAAALAAGMVPIATAADGGGSIRIPAAWSGLVGLKPTNGVIGRDPVPDWIDLSTDGPIAAEVDDVRLLLDVMAGPTPGDPTALPAPPGLTRSPARRLFAVPRWVDWGPLPPEVADLFELALRRAEEVFGLPIELMEPGRLFPQGNLDADWFSIAGPEHAHRLGRALIEARAGDLHPATRGFLEEGLRVPFETYLDARRRRFEYVRALDELLGDDGAILSPVMAIAGCPADGVIPGEDPGLPPDIYVTPAQNLTGHPAMSIPAGRSGNGVPFGLQVTAPRFRDAMLLDLAQTWERERPWPLVADGYEPFDT
jgi:Asp-tRNA(Asn)/Glu-tRNA(Gln) amidotransferase A subunit family amidase